jgi:hypothetical protein
MFYTSVALPRCTSTARLPENLSNFVLRFSWAPRMSIRPGWRVNLHQLLSPMSLLPLLLPVAALVLLSVMSYPAAQAGSPSATSSILPFVLLPTSASTLFSTGAGSMLNGDLSATSMHVGGWDVAGAIAALTQRMEAAEVKLAQAQGTIGYLQGKSNCGEDAGQAASRSDHCSASCLWLHSLYNGDCCGELYSATDFVC